MTTKMRPNGVTLEIQHEGKTYYGHLNNDWDKYKTYGNTDIYVVDELILFDENFDRIPYDDNLYETLTLLVEEHIFDNEYLWVD